MPQKNASTSLLFCSFTPPFLPLSTPPFQITPKSCLGRAGFVVSNSRMPESPVRTHGAFELPYNLNLRPHDFLYDHLGHSCAALHHIRLAAEIRDNQRNDATVIAVNGPRCIHKRDAMLQGQTAARTDLRLEP